MHNLRITEDIVSRLCDNYSLLKDSKTIYIRPVARVIPISQVRLLE
jgi:hypothetical protein